MKKFILSFIFVLTLCMAGDSGFKVNEVQPDSFYSKISIKAGDVIKKINGNDITGLNELMGFMGNPDTVKSVVVIRDGREKIINL